MLSEDDWNNVMNHIQKHGVPFLSQVYCGGCGAFNRLGIDTKYWGNRIIPNLEVITLGQLNECNNYGGFLIQVMCGNCSKLLGSIYEPDVIDYWSTMK